ncbi:MAG TPA: pyridoxamine 5'-phosphate oxidase family protein [Blastocatellia bacterium]|nr:pyridoxamine 5'-phosphate oxidase family protein [Blastocatellia bacterium]
MSEQKGQSGRNEPKADRPHMPGYGILAADEGSGLLPWSWATERLEGARNYWLSTTRPDGRPHAMPVWGVWLDDRLWFSTGKESRKARNIAANPNCVVCSDFGDEAVIIEGVVESITDPVLYRQFAEAYEAKYQWDMEGFAEPLYAVRPATTFAFISRTSEFTGSATRWRFDKE